MKSEGEIPLANKNKAKLGRIRCCIGGCKVKVKEVTVCNTVSQFAMVILKFATLMILIRGEAISVGKMR